jgi:hypothetical protein
MSQIVLTGTGWVHTGQGWEKDLGSDQFGNQISIIVPTHDVEFEAEHE